MTKNNTKTNKRISVPFVEGRRPHSAKWGWIWIFLFTVLILCFSCSNQYCFRGLNNQLHSVDEIPFVVIPLMNDNEKGDCRDADSTGNYMMQLYGGLEFMNESNKLGYQFKKVSLEPDTFLTYATYNEMIKGIGQENGTSVDSTNVIIKALMKMPGKYSAALLLHGRFSTYCNSRRVVTTDPITAISSNGMFNSDETPAFTPSLESILIIFGNSHNQVVAILKDYSARDPFVKENRGEQFKTILSLLSKNGYK